MKANTILVSLFAAFLLLGWPLTSMAHVHVKRSQPGDGETLTASPKTFQVWFSGKVSDEWSKVRITAADGTRVDTGEISNGDDPNHLSVALKPLDSGTYSVELNVISGDGHRVKGHYSFTVK
jgi:methionine-rich copper-binding protein CopC